ncbi:MAG: hypothetical protein ACTHKV_00100 [Flavipsychrobacter sp.]
MSTICDKGMLKTETTNTFTDLIDSFALQCKQIDTQNQSGLFMISGRIELPRSGSTNSVQWRGGAYDSINTDTALGASISFMGTPAAISITYPTTLTSGKTVKPIAAFVTPDLPFVSTDYTHFQTSYTFGTQLTGSYTNIIISRRVKYSGTFQYTASLSATNYWGIGAVSPLANSILSSYNSTTGIGNVVANNSPTGKAAGTVSFKMPYDLAGAPMLTPFPPAGTLVHPYFVTVELDTSDKSLFYVQFWDVVTGLQIIPDATNVPGFFADFGVTDEVVDAQTTNFEQTGILYFQGLYQAV